ncbi:hypothetical protein EO98_05640 [Methanosarcina sp. 2.H.T.1A.6]|uniref:hypothetical protein n=1 Tax=unclassified Methanosarcina TaxID=2644672 RepID=UPI0006224A4C|nr:MULTISPECIES: hypothetical protein [unclassified Methanosarcina]KKG13658.1 hypothetical protein EO94_11315 [Methanosarcina sp. 2.H.T.1A.3]KKG24872.1 hypothetical protein EO98_05640 [Methanosarcina sp. 2.H.T.1A.6]KKG26009.1 hypothetical protein EO96_15960 [Methanosarcina sp. 2.H.T.1A.8]KKG28721.1 hypothetical protein EO97_03485 [Methanosarcina sp. 2.H.T.1A.15]
MLTYYDQAFYYSNGVNLGSPKYYTHAVSSAKGAGYDYSVNNGPGGVNPGLIEGLDPRLGSDFRVNSMDLYYSNSSWFSISFLNNGDSTFSFWNEDPLAKYRPEDLPKREWVVNKFKIIYGMNEKEIEAYLPAENWGVNDIFFEQVTITRHPDIAAIRRHLLEGSTSSTFDAENSAGEGGSTETFYNGSEKIGSISYFVQAAEISFKEGSSTYTVHIDRLGGVRLYISLRSDSSGNKIPEKEYRAVFKRIFIDLGLPPEKVDEVEFEYGEGFW